MLNRICWLLLVTCWVIGTSWAADNPFVGKWKLNPSRSKLSDEMKVERLSGNKYAFDFGSGDPETIVADGTDQPANSATTLAVTAEAPNKWKVVRKKDGITIITATWELSQNGNTLTDHFTNISSNGIKSSLDYVYDRTAGTAGFAGTWESDSVQVNSVFEFQIEPYEEDGLSFINPAQQTTKNIKFDGKDYPGSGPSLPKDFTTSGHRVSALTIQLTDKLAGKIVDTRQVDLSPDLKTLTMTVRTMNHDKPNILVFERE
jgi:hypothetical protein